LTILLNISNEIRIKIESPTYKLVVFFSAILAILFLRNILTIIRINQKMDKYENYFASLEVLT
ncbi:hypothetical protein ACVULL_003940, partial [Acinetobacter baumannii]